METFGRLTIITQKKFINTSRGLEATGAFMVQMRALLDHFERLEIHAPLAEGPDVEGLNAEDPRIDFRPLPYYEGKRGFLRELLTMKRKIREALDSAELALIILPGYPTLLAGWMSGQSDAPVFMWVVGDWAKVVASRRPDFPGRLLSVFLWTPAINRMMRHITDPHLVFFNGRVIYRPDNPNHFTRVSSSIRDSDLVDLHTGSWGRPLKLLFVGRLAAEKGIPDLLKAVDRLCARGVDVRLEIVGFGEEEGALRALTASLNLQSRVCFAGYLSHGPALTDLYRRNHLFVLPSLDDMQPKVLMEAMCHGLPVVATDVGAVSTIIRHGENGLLVCPGRPDDIVRVVGRLDADPDLRSHLVEKGHAFVRAHTVERETSRMVEVLGNYLEVPSSFE